MTKIIEQTEAQALIPEQSIFMWEDKPYYKENVVMKWKNHKGFKYQEYDHTEIDYTQYEADDGTYINVGNCRCCKKTIKPYTEAFYKKVYDYNQWYNLKINKDLGYCKKCALDKAVIEHHGRNLSLEVEKEFTSVRDDQEVVTKIMRDGSIIEEMTIKEKARIINH